MKRLLPALLLSLFAGASAFAAEEKPEPLSAIPDDVFMVVRLSSIDTVTGHAKDVIQSLGPAAAPALREVPIAVRGFLNLQQEPTPLTSVDRKAPVYAAVWPFFDRREPVMWMVKAADEAALQRDVCRAREGEKLMVEKSDLGFDVIKRGSRSYFFRKHGDYTIYTRDEPTAKLIAEKLKQRGRIADVMTPAGKKVFLAGDMGFAFHSAVATERHKDDINEAREEILKQIKAIPDAGSGVPNPEAARQLYSSLANFAFDALFDAKLATANVTFGAKGGTGEAFVTLKDNTKTGKLLAANPAHPVDTLELLPAAAPVYGGFSFDTQSWSDQWSSMYLDNSKLSKEEMAKAKREMEEGGMQAIFGMIMLPKDNETGLQQVVLEEAKDAARLRNGFKRIVQGMAKMEMGVMSQEATLKPAAEKYKTHVIDRIDTKIMPGKEAAAAILKDFFTRIFGGEVFQSRMTHIDNILITATGNKPAIMQKVIDRLESGEDVAGLDDAFAGTRDKLLDESNVILMVDAPKLIRDGVRMISDIPPYSLLLAASPYDLTVETKPSYAGVSVGFEESTVRAKAHLPIEQVQGILKMFPITE